MQPETLERTQSAARSTANLFRLGMEGAANDMLVTLIDGLTELLRDVAPERADEIGHLLSDAVRAQERGDVLRVADLVEFELLPRLEPAEELAE